MPNKMTVRVCESCEALDLQRLGKAGYGGNLVPDLVSVLAFCPIELIQQIPDGQDHAGPLFAELEFRIGRVRGAPWLTVAKHDQHRVPFEFRDFGAEWGHKYIPF